MEAMLTVAKAATAKGVHWGISVPGTEKTRQEMFKLGSRDPRGN